MKLTMSPISFNGGPLGREEFGYRTISILDGGKGFVPAGIDSIVFWCPNGTRRLCQIPLTLGPQVDSPERRWHWDGNMAEPTVSPSIGCDRRCGWHGNITKGETKAS